MHYYILRAVMFKYRIGQMLKCVCKEGQVMKHRFMRADVCEGVSRDVVVQ